MSGISLTQQGLLNREGFSDAKGMICKVTDTVGELCQAFCFVSVAKSLFFAYWLRRQSFPKVSPRLVTSGYSRDRGSMSSGSGPA